MPDTLLYVVDRAGDLAVVWSTVGAELFLRGRLLPWADERLKVFLAGRRVVATPEAQESVTALGGIVERLVDSGSLPDATAGLQTFDSYFAKRCVLRCQLDLAQRLALDTDGAPLPQSRARRSRLARVKEFESKIVRDLSNEHGPGFHSIEGPSIRDRIMATRNAMESGVSHIHGGALPADSAGRRVGGPDLLVRDWTTDTQSRPTYLPVEIKAHRPEGSAGALRTDDFLQLAHYQRMLESCGYASESPRVGVIGPGPVWAWAAATASELADYDKAFQVRKSAVESVMARGRSAYVAPIWSGECQECPWRDRCLAILQEDSGDISLLPGITQRNHRVHRSLGNASRADIASLDRATAKLVHCGVNVARLQKEAARGLMRPDAPAADLLPPRAKRQRRILAENGVATVRDLLALDGRTAAYSGSSAGNLPRIVDEARAALGDHPAYQRPGRDLRRIPRGDVEIDIDMENSEAGLVYLWGCLVKYRRSNPPAGWPRPGYHAFSTFDDSSDSELQTFNAFWDWLTVMRSQTSSKGWSLRCYVYNQAAENGRIRSLSAFDESRAQQAQDLLADASTWVDLRPFFESQVITGENGGLKHAAKLAGFAWRAEDQTDPNLRPGGDNSMWWYQEAIRGDETMRRHILEYNEDDVRATSRLRGWLEKVGELPLLSWPS